jgi:hypothetical protein
MTREELAQGVRCETEEKRQVALKFLSGELVFEAYLIDKHLYWARCPEQDCFWAKQHENPTPEGIELFKRKLAAYYNYPYTKPKLVTKFTKWVQQHEAV